VWWIAPKGFGAGLITGAVPALNPRRETAWPLHERNTAEKSPDCAPFLGLTTPGFLDAGET
jgi:hypothetical protein